MDKVREIIDVPVISRCTHVNILKILKDMESYFRCQMAASADIFGDSAQAFADETWDDLQLKKAELRILREVHLISADECHDLERVFSDIRYEYLDKVTTAQENNNTEDKDNGN